MWTGFYDVFAPAASAKLEIVGDAIGAAGSGGGRGDLEMGSTTRRGQGSLGGDSDDGNPLDKINLKFDLKLLGKVGSAVQIAPGNGIISLKQESASSGLSSSSSSRRSRTVYGKHKIEQDKLYFEVEVMAAVSSGRSGKAGSEAEAEPEGTMKIYVGLTNTVPATEEDDESGSDPTGEGAVPKSGAAQLGHGCEVDAREGDVVSCTYDQANYPTFSVYLNAVLLDTVTGMKGQLLPYVSLLSEGSIRWRFFSVGRKEDHSDFAAFDNFMSARSYNEFYADLTADDNDGIRLTKLLAMFLDPTLREVETQVLIRLVFLAKMLDFESAMVGPGGKSWLWLKWFYT
eukprot:g13474.t1